MDIDKNTLREERLAWERKHAPNALLSEPEDVLHEHMHKSYVNSVKGDILALMRGLKTSSEVNV